MEKVKLRSWLELEQIRQKIEDSAIDEVAYLIHSYLSIAVSTYDKNAPWYEIAGLFQDAIQTNVPSKPFPILNSKSTEGSDWDYEGRNWYLWAHLLASNYGWSLEYVAEMEVDDAIGLLQEIFADEFMTKEWEWNTSEVAYMSKNGYKPLSKPSWMRKPPKEPKKVKIPKSMLPVGNVVRWNQEPST